jgi:hypothetical protein
MVVRRSPSVICVLKRVNMDLVIKEGSLLAQSNQLTAR